MKKVKDFLAEFLFWFGGFLLVGITYFIVDNYRSFKKRKRGLRLDKEGRITEYNPWTDKW